MGPILKTGLLLIIPVSHPKKLIYYLFVGTVNEQKQWLSHPSANNMAKQSLTDCPKLHEELHEEFLNAAKNGDCNKVLDLLDRGEEIDRPNNNGYTALMYAAGKGHHDIVKQLLDRGAVVDFFDNGGGTALILAVHSGHQNVVRLLLDRGAKIDHLNNLGWSALTHIASEGYQDMVELLLNHGADPENKIDIDDYLDGIQEVFRQVRQQRERKMIEDKLVKAASRLS